MLGRSGATIPSGVCISEDTRNCGSWICSDKECTGLALQYDFEIRSKESNKMLDKKRKFQEDKRWKI